MTDRAAADGSIAAEFRRGWPVVACAASGAGLGVAGLLTYGSSLFVKPLERALGLTRTEFGFIFFGATAAMALASPLAGRWLDRSGSRPVALAGALALTLGFLGLATLATGVAGYAALMVLTGCAAIGSSPLAYTRAVSAAFDRGRGLALGLTQVGLGVAGAAVPPLLSARIEAHGWRAGFLFLAVLALAGTLPALLIGTGRNATPPHGDAIGEARAALRSPLFRRQMAAFVVMALGFGGVLPHYVAMLRDAGLSPADAAGYAALIGVSVIGSRIVVGALADVIHAPWLAAAACLLVTFGCLLLAVGGAGAALAGAVTLGCALGAEADLIGYMTARSFGVAVYGRVYARQYAAFILATGAGPAWVGLAHDRSGGYALPLAICAGLLGLAAALFLALPRPLPRG